MAGKLPKRTKPRRSWYSTAEQYAEALISYKFNNAVQTVGFSTFRDSLISGYNLYVEKQSPKDRRLERRRYERFWQTHVSHVSQESRVIGFLSA